MARKAIIWTAIGLVVVSCALVLFTNIVGIHPAILPSRKPETVIPLLNRIDTTGSPRSIYDQIHKILGESNSGKAGGPISQFWGEYEYKLDDNSTVTVVDTSSKGELVDISINLPGQPQKNLWKKPIPAH